MRAIITLIYDATSELHSYFKLQTTIVNQTFKCLKLCVEIELLLDFNHFKNTMTIFNVFSVFAKTLELQPGNLLVDQSNKKARLDSFL